MLPSIVTDFPNLSKPIAFCLLQCYDFFHQQTGGFVENKFEVLRPFINEILTSIKKDIKTDYLPGDKIFYKTHFGNRPLNRLQTEEIFAAVEKDLLAGNESLQEWVVNHWVFKHGDIYSHFAEKLSEIRPDFDELKELTEAESRHVLEGTEAFDPVSTYLFSALNGVVFPAAVFESLKTSALAAKERQEAAAASDSQKETLEQIIERQQRELSRLQEKYESKVSGVLRKYQMDTEALKKQIRALQKQQR